MPSRRPTQSAMIQYESQVDDAETHAHGNEHVLSLLSPDDCLEVAAGRQSLLRRFSKGQRVREARENDAVAAEEAAWSTASAAAAGIDHHAGILEPQQVTREAPQPRYNVSSGGSGLVHLHARFPEIKKRAAKLSRLALRGNHNETRLLHNAMADVWRRFCSPVKFSRVDCLEGKEAKPPKLSTRICHAANRCVCKDARGRGTAHCRKTLHMSVKRSIPNFGKQRLFQSQVFIQLIGTRPRVVNPVCNLAIDPEAAPVAVVWALSPFVLHAP